MEALKRGARKANLLGGKFLGIPLRDFDVLNDLKWCQQISDGELYFNGGSTECHALNNA